MINLEGAVPIPYSVTDMTLRDWFAGQVIAGIMAMPSDDSSGNFHNNCGEPFKGPAEYAYLMADAMLAARQKEKPGDAGPPTS
jgi:hypothetical protein